MKLMSHFILASVAIVLACAGIGAALTIGFSMADDAPQPPASATSPDATPPVLAVTVGRPQTVPFRIRVPASGNIMAWQEASIGTEANGLRLIEVKAQVGDSVRRGQTLAVFSAETVEAELAQSRAAVAEADVALAEAAANAQRARMLQDSGALSEQQIQQYLNAERSAQARLASARAVERMHALRLAQTRVTAPDDGIISSRTATVGAVLPAGQELFRFIRRGRLEWHAEVASAELSRLRPGQVVRVTPPGSDSVEGRLRMLSPVIDTQTRNGLVYVDLPLGHSARAGMFARGEIEVGTRQVTALPQGAVLLREGHGYVMQVGPDARVTQSKVTTGLRQGSLVEIVSGLDPDARVVFSGAALLGTGDRVRVVTAPPASEQPAAN